MFEVGDEVVCVDDSPMQGIPLQIKKGEVFKVLSVYPEGSFLPCGRPSQYEAATTLISIGRINPYHAYWAEVYDPGLTILDLWGAERFRKVERKRTREELYALIGIGVDAMGGVCVPELV